MQGSQEGFLGVGSESSTGMWGGGGEAPGLCPKAVGWWGGYPRDLYCQAKGLGFCRTHLSRFGVRQ